MRTQDVGNSAGKDEQLEAALARFRFKLEEEEFLPMPAVAWKILDMTSDMYIGSQGLEEVISYDPGLTARILKLANSAYFGLRGKVTTIRQALTVLGNQRLRAAAVAFSLQGVFNRTGLGRSVWEHSLAVALVARSLGAKDSGVEEDEAYVGGLLHDIGKCVIDQNCPTQYSDVMDLVGEAKIPLREAERDVLGVDHAEVGAVLSHKWNLPVHIRECIAFHHDFDRSVEAPRLCAVVHLANTICMQRQLGPVKRPELDASECRAFEVLGLENEVVEQVTEGLEARLEQEMTHFSGS